MTLTAWRIVHERYRSTALEGEGAWLHGGRFNSRGTRMVYGSSVLALAILELLVHLDRTRPLARHVAISLSIDESLVRYVDPIDLPRDWKAFATPAATQLLGDQWIESGASVALAVPSVLLPDGTFGSEHNILLNPRHAQFAALKIGEPQPLPFDTAAIRGSVWVTRAGFHPVRPAASIRSAGSSPGPSLRRARPGKLP